VTGPRSGFVQDSQIGVSLNPSLTIRAFQPFAAIERDLVGRQYAGGVLFMSPEKV
jgi:hypothetical protein